MVFNGAVSLKGQCRGKGGCSPSPSPGPRQFGKGGWISALWCPPQAWITPRSRICWDENPPAAAGTQAAHAACSEAASKRLRLNSAKDLGHSLRYQTLIVRASSSLGMARLLKAELDLLHPGCKRRFCLPGLEVQPCRSVSQVSGDNCTRRPPSALVLSSPGQSSGFVFSFVGSVCAGCSEQCAGKGAGL